MSQELNPVLEHMKHDFDAAVERLKDLLRIPSISTDPRYASDVRRAAQWCAERLGAIGFDATLRDTPGHPMVVAHAQGPPDRPHILYYGHYDVQPPDPLDEWKSPPFEPSIVRGPKGLRIIARGAVDDKGQLMTFIEAFGAWKSVHGSLPVGVTVLLEGEEESGSPSLDGFLSSCAEELAADVCVVCDTAMWDIATPAITTMLRGLVYLEVTLRGPSHDLHSGMYGGAVVNPINALARMLAELHSPGGRVNIAGFYDDVRELPEAQAKRWASLNFDEKAFLGEAGLAQSQGESNRTVLERIWSRPTCDVNGIWGGYTGAGAKTVIPSHASAKLSCRLVPEQDPQDIADRVIHFLEERTPPGCALWITRHGASPAIQVPTDSMYLEAAMRGLRAVFDREPVLIGCGGSIPVVGSIQKILGFESLLVGFGLDDDRVHSPNEKFEVRCYESGIRSHAAILEQLSHLPASKKRQVQRT